MVKKESLKSRQIAEAEYFKLMQLEKTIIEKSFELKNLKDKIIKLRKKLNV